MKHTVIAVDRAKLNHRLPALPNFVFMKGTCGYNPCLDVDRFMQSDLRSTRSISHGCRRFSQRFRLRTSTPRSSLVWPGRHAPVAGIGGRGGCRAPVVSPAALIHVIILISGYGLHGPTPVVSSGHRLCG